MVSGAVYAIVLVRPIARGLARAGVVRGTAVAAEEGKTRLQGQTA
jgi:energy-coupling factor transport system substrate-specific component